MPETKKCSRCREVKPVTEFWKMAGKPDGLRPSCSKCSAAKKNTPLRAVADGEVASPTRFMSVDEAAARGSTRDLLIAMRQRIAVEVANPKTPARDLASLTKRLSEVVREIEIIDVREAEQPSADSGPVDDEQFDASAV